MDGRSDYDCLEAEFFHPLNVAPDTLLGSVSPSAMHHYQ